MVLNPWNVDALIDLEKDYDNKVNTVLQLRHHNAILDLKSKIDNGPKDQVYDIDLTYITSRGNWYYTSWKGDESKSGGIASNIGVHFFDMLQWIFGPMQDFTVNEKSHDTNAGTLVLERAKVNWYLSINAENLPESVKSKGIATYRTLLLKAKKLNLVKALQIYIPLATEILEGKGYGLADAKNAIEIVSQIRNKNI